MTKCMWIPLVENFNRAIFIIYKKLLENHADHTNIIFVFMHYPKVIYDAINILQILIVKIS